ncbi:MAG: ATP-binding protein [Bacteroidota bacterium]
MNKINSPDWFALQNEEKEKRSALMPAPGGIAEEKSAEEKLQKSLKEISDYKHALDESSIVAITDQEGIIKHVNNNFCRISKYSSGELIGQDHRIINSGYHPKEFIRDLWTTIASGKIWNGELRNKASDGSIYWVDTTIVPFLNESGKPYQYVAIKADITKRKNAERLLISNKEEKEKRAAELIIANKELLFQNEEKENRAAELFIANKELVFQNKEKENRAAELIIANRELAFQNEEKENRAAELIIANRELAFQNEEKENRAAELIIANRELAFQNVEKESRAAELIVANKELAFQNKEKENRAAELIIANKELAFQNEEKEKRAAELIIANKELAFENDKKEKRATDLIVANKELAFQNEEKEKRAVELMIANRDLKISEEQFKEVNKELEAFSYSVSHDLRAPLRAVQGYARMLKGNYEAHLDPEADRLMNNIVNNAKKMGHLIDDLLTFSRIGRKELVMKTILMQEVVTNLCNELRNEQSSRDIDIRIKELFPVRADYVTIKQVWLNLISNALKYTGLKDVTIIEIGSEIKGDEIVYYIKDNGAGFDMRYAGKLFGVFQRLHSDEEFEGTGVGLALVQRIISKHGGRVWAEAKADEGATFFFSLNKS